MSNKKKAVIFGTGEFAEVAHFYLTNDSDYQVAAFTASRAHIAKDSILGLPVTPFEDIEKNYPPGQYDMFIAIAYGDRNKTREKFYREAKDKKYKLLSYVSSQATTWPGLSIGDNCFIFEDNTIQPFVKIGNNVIIWSGNHIGHHSVIEDHCFIASHCVISGLCRVKEYSFIGVNATLRDGITIEKENIIGAGALILKNTQEGQVYPGLRSSALPAKDSAKIKLD
jgi:sugar O-acyltransferase (sialic acid O-acetyltransferase NeuD family)